MIGIHTSLFSAFSFYIIWDFYSLIFFKVTFPVVVIKYCNKSKSKEKAYWGSQFEGTDHMAGKPELWDVEAPVHCPTFRKQRMMNACAHLASTCYTAQAPSPGNHAALVYRDSPQLSQPNQDDP